MGALEFEIRNLRDLGSLTRARMSWYIWAQNPQFPEALVWADVLAGQREPCFLDWLHFSTLSEQQQTDARRLMERGERVGIRGWSMVRLPSEATRVFEPLRWARRLPPRNAAR